MPPVGALMSTPLQAVLRAQRSRGTTQPGALDSRRFFSGPVNFFPINPHFDEELFRFKPIELRWILVKMYDTCYSNQELFTHML